MCLVPTLLIFADVSLALSIAVAALLTVGVILAVLKRYTAHRWVQTAAVLLNIGLVAVVMFGSFVNSAAPGIPVRLNQPHYAIAAVHGLAGLVAALFHAQLAAEAQAAAASKAVRRHAEHVYNLIAGSLDPITDHLTGAYYVCAISSFDTGYLQRPDPGRLWPSAYEPRRRAAERRACRHYSRRRANCRCCHDAYLRGSYRECSNRDPRTGRNQWHSRLAQRWEFSALGHSRR